MNLWECEGRTESGNRCTNTAMGVGGGIGLRAIGWYFVRRDLPGAGLYCPFHRPDRLVCREREGEPCQVCMAETEAAYWQGKIREQVEG